MSFVIGSTPGQTDRLTVRFSFLFSCASICLSACRCNKQGSASLVCNQYTGRCSCKPDVRGRRCDECPVKSYGFPTCLGEFQESSLLNQAANWRIVPSAKLCCKDIIQWKMVLLLSSTGDRREDIQTNSCTLFLRSLWLQLVWFIRWRCLLWSVHRAVSL